MPEFHIAWMNIALLLGGLVFLLYGVVNYLSGIFLGITAGLMGDPSRFESKYTTPICIILGVALIIAAVVIR